jgi:hypothetical protein
MPAIGLLANSPSLGDNSLAVPEPSSFVLFLIFWLVLAMKYGTYLPRR